MPFIVQNIDEHKFTLQGIAYLHYQLHCFRRLDTADNTQQGRHNTIFNTSFFDAGTFLIETAVTG